MTEKRNIRLSKPSIDNEEIEAIKAVADTGCLAGTCEEVTKFEEEFAAFVGSKYAVATSNCTTALHLAVLAVMQDKDHKKGKVVLPAYTFPATANAPLYCGRDLEICDIDHNTWNMDVESIRTRSPSIVMPVHCFGNPSGLQEVMDYANERGSMVIEDAACAIPAYCGNKHAGTIGDIGCYSFYAIKNLCTGEGGMLVTDNEDYAEFAKSMSDFGKVETFTPTDQMFGRIGYNYRMSAIQAAMGRVQLRKIPEMYEKRQKIAELYDSSILQGASNFVFPQAVELGCQAAYQRYAIRLANGFDRNAIMASLKEMGVQTAIGTHDLSSISLYDKYHKGCPVSKQVASQSLSLPIYPDMPLEDAEYVLECLKNALVTSWKGWKI